MFELKGFKSFSESWAGFHSDTDVTVFIGKNNSGKSALLDLIATTTNDDWKNLGLKTKCPIRHKVLLKEDDLRRTFHELSLIGYNTQGVNNPWTDIGIKLINKPMNIELIADTNGKLTVNEIFLDLNAAGIHPHAQSHAIFRLKDAALSTPPTFHGQHVYRISAERDISIEPASDSSFDLRINGAGATNIVRRCLNSSGLSNLRTIFEKNLIPSFNLILGGELEIINILIRQHDSTAEEHGQGIGGWEIYFLDVKGREIPLSKSGSGLKTILLVLLNLLIIPAQAKHDLKNCIFIIEEPENNLHPSIQRRLVKYIIDYCLDRKSKVFFSTHSPSLIDIAQGYSASIFKVTCVSGVSKVDKISSWTDLSNAISDIGGRPSDLLYANCVIWVEGPSDRIYINHWIKLLAPDLIDGRDYLCAYYGGSLLSNVEFNPSSCPEVSRFCNLLRMNKNVIFIADGDRTSQSGIGSELKARVRRASEEVQSVNGHVWITKSKEIENYIPASILSELWHIPDLPPIGKFEVFHIDQCADNRKQGYLQKHKKDKSFDKSKLAYAVINKFTANHLNENPELKTEITAIVDKIKHWTKL